MSSDGRAVEATAAAAAAERVLEGAALLKSGAFSSAIEKFDEAIALDPNSAPRQVRVLHCSVHFMKLARWRRSSTTLRAACCVLRTCFSACGQRD
jgi:hypothetical protein